MATRFHPSQRRTASLQAAAAVRMLSPLRAKDTSTSSGPLNPIATALLLSAGGSTGKAPSSSRTSSTNSLAASV